MSDIVERLKSVAKAGGTGWEDEQDETVRRFISDAAWAAKDAADEIESLRAKVEVNDKHEQRRVAENRALRERLEKLAKHTKALIDARWMFTVDWTNPDEYEALADAATEALRALDGEGE